MIHFNRSYPSMIIYAQYLYINWFNEGTARRSQRRPLLLLVLLLYIPSRSTFDDVEREQCSQRPFGALLTQCY